MVSLLGNVHDRIEVSRLSGGGQHTGISALQVTDLGRHGIVCRVLEACVEIA